MFLLPLELYLVEVNFQPNFTFIRKVCNMFQTYDDVEDSWVALLEATNYFGYHAKEMSDYTGNGSWNYNYYVNKSLLIKKDQDRSVCILSPLANTSNPTSNLKKN